MTELHTFSPEQQYANTVSYKIRKKFGQFFTPPDIAQFMVDWVIGDSNNITLLDPALGLGIFFRCVVNKYRNRTIKFFGYEIDREIFVKVKDLFKKIVIDTELINRDYLRSNWDEKFDGIICNPPYLKLHNYKNKKELLELYLRKGFELSGLTNIYTLFLLKSLHQLKPGGRMAYIVPSEFLNADYGVQVKKYLKKSGLLRSIIVINFETEVFKGATTTSSILLFANDRYKEEVEFFHIEKIEELKKIEEYLRSHPSKGQGGRVYKLSELKEEEKWKIYYRKRGRSVYKNLVPFSKFAKITRGIATGANDYFTFTNSKREKYQIPQNNLLPCLTKARDVKKHFFTEKDFQNLLKENRPVYLLHVCNFPLDEKLKEYLKMGIDKRINRRYLTRHRRPWYSVEKRLPAPILVTVFNRRGLKFIRNEMNVYNLTAFHCVYLKNSYFHKIDLLMAYLITDVAGEIFMDSAREYGGGLKKFEPNDLNNARVLDLEKIEPDKEEEILDLYKKFRDLELKNLDTTAIRTELNKIFLSILEG